MGMPPRSHLALHQGPEGTRNFSGTLRALNASYYVQCVLQTRTTPRPSRGTFCFVCSPRSSHPIPIIALRYWGPIIHNLWLCCRKLASIGGPTKPGTVGRILRVLTTHLMYFPPILLMNSTCCSPPFPWPIRMLCSSPGLCFSSSPARVFRDPSGIKGA